VLKQALQVLRDACSMDSVTGWLIQILLPLYDNSGVHFGEDAFARTRTELLHHFGGVTAHQRAPARGLWKTGDGDVARDDVAVFEVMSTDLDRAWWDAYRPRGSPRMKERSARMRHDEGAGGIREFRERAPRRRRLSSTTRPPAPADAR